MLQSLRLNQLLTKAGYQRQAIITASTREQEREAIIDYDKTLSQVNKCFASKAGAIATIASQSLPIHPEDYKDFD